jgi:phosphonate transport system ATP-binding protein
MPRLDVLTNVLLGRLNHRSAVLSILNLFTREERIMAIAALERLGIEQTALQPAGTLSGGQQQRVAIARALMQNPKMLLADEPIASLDPLNAKIVMDALRDINEREGITVITNLHTLDTARAYCERIIGMSGGRVVFDGPARELDAEAVRTIYGTGADGAEIDESVTSTAIRNPARQDNIKESASPTPLALAGL